jgi:hypothetical protein
MRFKIQDKWKWLSEDSCGAQYFSTNRPNLRDTGTWGGGGINTYSPIAFDLGPDYRDSLHQVVDGELVKCKEPKPVCADCEELKRKVRVLVESNNVETLLRACRGLALDPMPSTLKVDDKVWVASSVVDGWVPRHYSGASSTPGNIWCFNDSRTSFTIEKGGTTEWSVWQRAIDGVDPNES